MIFNCGTHCLAQTKFSDRIIFLKMLQEHLTYKLHFTEKKKFLYLKYPVSYTVANHFTRHGHFKRVYLKLWAAHTKLYRFYINERRSWALDYLQSSKLAAENIEFFREVNFENFLYNLNYTLVWQGLNLKPIVRLNAFQYLKKYKTRLRYVKPERRLILVWLWLTILAKIDMLAVKNLDLMFYNMLQTFFCLHYSKQHVFRLRSETYQVFLLTRL